MAITPFEAEALLELIYESECVECGATARDYLFGTGVTKDGLDNIVESLRLIESGKG